MRIWRSSLLIIGLCVLVLSSMTAVAETDGTGDIYHWYWNADSGTFGWQVTVDEKPNIDIIELSYTISEETATFVMKVAGNIEDAQYISYWATYTSDEVTYFYTYANGEVLGMASNSETTSFDMEAAVTVLEDTLTVEFDSVGEGITNLEFYGHAHIWTETGGESGESWWDYAPDTFFTGDLGDDTEGDENDGTTPPSGTPGFETLAVIAALGIAFIMLRRRN